MALREELIRSGGWLFRWRGYLPLALFVPVLAGLRGSDPPIATDSIDGAWEVLCVFVSLLGIATRIATVGRAPGGTSGRRTLGGPSAASLNTTGMYSVVRHPLYLGNYFAWLGVALIARNAWVAVTVSLAFWIYYERIMFAEEAYLRQSFGGVFEEWAARTPAFIPDFGRWVPAELPFCWRTAIRRENSGMFALVAAFTFVSTAQDVVVSGRLDPDPAWIVTFTLSAFTYLALSLLSRRTKVLRVPGR